jgi:hypothetical protein
LFGGKVIRNAALSGDTPYIEVVGMIGRNFENDPLKIRIN